MMLLTASPLQKTIWDVYTYSFKLCL